MNNLDLNIIMIFIGLLGYTCARPLFRLVWLGIATISFGIVLYHTYGAIIYG